MTASRNGKTPTSKALETLEGQLKQLQNARELYNEGKEEDANDILAVLGLYKDVYGNPKPASKVFGTSNPIKFDPNNLNERDREAYQYAIDNPTDPRSQEILKRLGAN